MKIKMMKIKRKLGSVVFEYSLQAAARTEIPNTVTSVKYSFRNAENSTVFFTNSYEVPHQSTKVDQASLTIREVPITAKTVVAAYGSKFSDIRIIGNYLTKNGDLDSNICDYILLDENMIPNYPTPRIEPNNFRTSPYFDFGSDNGSYILEIGSSVKSGSYTLSVGDIDKLPGYNATTIILR